MNFFLISSLLLSAIFSTGNCKEVCYPEIGCFTNDPPFDDMPLPIDPAEMVPTWHVYVGGRKESHTIQSSLELDVEHLYVFVHGYTGNYNNTAMWHQPIAWNLLTLHPDHNLLFVEWSKGAAAASGLSIYTQAASNGRAIGRVIINFLEKNPKFDSTKVHCLGFSLGAHVCGFAGKAAKGGWGRISAMDPAALSFSKADPRARIDKSDAAFVDVIHSSLTAGIQRSIGHVDFWPNGAKRQPGCITRRRRSIKENPLRYDNNPLPNHEESGDTELEISDNHKRAYERGFVDDVEAIFGCSHYRAAFLYANTILNPDTCNFKFCPCSNYFEYEVGYCTKCDPAVAQFMGYTSINYPGRGDYFGETTKAEPFCMNQQKKKN